MPRHAYKGVALLFLNRSLLFQWGSVPYSPPDTVLVAHAEESPNNSPIVYTVWFWSAWGYGTKSSHLCELAGPTAAIQGTCGMAVSGRRSWCRACRPWRCITWFDTLVNSMEHAAAVLHIIWFYTLAA